MYNIHSHYENVFHLLGTIIAHPRVLYLHPFGSTQPENIESLSESSDSDSESPLFIMYDQEPIYGEFNHKLFDYIRDNIRGPCILVSTERDSTPLSQIQKRYGWPVVDYFHHALVASDWFRGHRYDARLIPPKSRTINKKFITFNRLTSASRVYRSLLISELIKLDVLESGYVSYNDVCPEGGTYTENLMEAVATGLITEQQANAAIANISSIKLPLRIDYQDHAHIPNHSFSLSAVNQTQESFAYIVTETCFWEEKKHLTEKIFKPIVSRMPFILLGPAHNLKYLRSYGFRTFNDYWSEEYDDISDPILRLEAVSKLISDICSLSLGELKDLLVTISPILEHNFNLFYSHKFVDSVWEELRVGLSRSTQFIKLP